MNTEIAEDLLRRELLGYKEKRYSDIAQLVDQTVRPTVEEPWQVIIQFYWNDGIGGNVRVIGSIDDGGLRAVCPLTDSFIMGRDGECIGEQEV